MVKSGAFWLMHNATNIETQNAQVDEPRVEECQLWLELAHRMLVYVSMPPSEWSPKAMAMVIEQGQRRPMIGGRVLEK
ncbi:hypothetical protein BLOT_005661 [Blomia tropicalis]|nr:hypothetical protein BLOT_005661 [Blomia tropicalis]